MLTIFLFFASDEAEIVKKKEKKKQKKVAHIVSFDDDDAQTTVESKHHPKHDKDNISNISGGSEDVFKSEDSIQDGGSSRSCSKQASLERVSSTVSSVSMASSDILLSDQCSRSSRGSFSSVDVDELG